MWNSTSALVRLTQATSKQVQNHAVFLVCDVSGQNLKRAARKGKNDIQKLTDNLFKTFVEVQRPSNQGAALKLGKFHLERSQIPGIAGPFACQAREHLWMCPAIDPCLHVAQTNLSPHSIYDRGTSEASVLEWIHSLIGVLGKLE